MNDIDNAAELTRLYQQLRWEMTALNRCGESVLTTEREAYQLALLLVSVAEFNAWQGVEGAK